MRRKAALMKGTLTLTLPFPHTPCRYASGDIFYMEVCWYDQLCSNRDELWALNAADPWHCEMNWRSYQELLEWILPTGKTFFDGG